MNGDHFPTVSGRTSSLIFRSCRSYRRCCAFLQIGSTSWDGHWGSPNLRRRRYLVDLKIRPADNADRQLFGPFASALRYCGPVLAVPFKKKASSLLKNPRHGESVVIQFSVTNRRSWHAGHICRSGRAVFVHRTGGAGAGEPSAEKDPGTRTRCAERADT